MHQGVILAEGIDRVEVSWQPPPEMVDGARKIGVALVFVWLFFILMKMALPGNRFSMSRAFSPISLIGAAVLVLILLDLNLAARVATVIVNGAIAIWGMITSLSA